MSTYKCCACDVRLTVEQLRVETGICPPCRAELEAVRACRACLKLMPASESVQWNGWSWCKGCKPEGVTP